MSSSTDRTCGGECCVAFYLPFKEPAWERAREEEDPSSEVGKIANMVIPITNSTVRRRRKKFKSELGPVLNEHEGHYFKCRHWDEETRLCGNYEERPMMCRAFPYSEEPDACRHGCGHCPTKETLDEWRDQGGE